ncbi:MAG: hypothetical protein ACTSQA_01200 [Candidatus Heimdallarchaeaceae archaeon]
MKNFPALGVTLKRDIFAEGFEEDTLFYIELEDEYGHYASDFIGACTHLRTDEGLTEDQALTVLDHLINDLVG